MDFSEERYEEMLGRLFVRFPSFQKEGAKAYKPGLGNMLLIDGLLAHPHRKYRCVHIAGTNGKGSVSNMLAAALSAEGLKVGLYTSPHILDFRERMRIVEDGSFRLIPKQAVWDFINKWQDTFDNVGMSFFEITTAMAFEWFAAEKVDIAVIETGLGGRLDSTNIITPEISVITNIGLDHCDLLGNTLPEIAYEKAGIIKPGVPVVIGESNPDTDDVFEKKVKYTSGEGKDLLHFADKEPCEGLEILENLDLKGVYQEKNLRTALCALKVMGIKPSYGAIEHTAEITGFHGRWEKVCDNPEVICDIGHNAHGLKYNFSQLSALAAEGRRLLIVYGSVSDKDVDSSLALMPSDATIFFTNASSKRAMPSSQVLSKFLSFRPGADAKAYENVAEAVDASLEMARTDSSTLIYIGGSTYVVAEALAHMKNKLL